jgi:beta-glucosidase
LSVDSAAKTVHFTIKNTGKIKGTEIAEVYARLPKGSDEPYKRLVGWARISLAPGESQELAVSIDSRVLETFDEGTEGWKLSPGDYEVLVGPSSADTPLAGSLHLQ